MIGESELGGVAPKDPREVVECRMIAVQVAIRPKSKYVLAVKKTQVGDAPGGILERQFGVNIRGETFTLTRPTGYG